MIHTQAATELARRFHATYERLAPAYGYSTRAETSVAWEDLPKANKHLMVATAEMVLRSLQTDPLPRD
jgi:hypothetical protein